MIKHPSKCSIKSEYPSLRALAKQSSALKVTVLLRQGSQRRFFYHINAQNLDAIALLPYLYVPEHFSYDGITDDYMAL